MATSDPLGETYEETHVHQVYQEIADHFSQTRYKVCHPRLLWYIDLLEADRRPSPLSYFLAMANRRTLPQVSITRFNRPRHRLWQREVPAR